MMNIEVLDRKCKTSSGEFPTATACITYIQNDEVFHLINSAIMDDEILSEQMISGDYELFYILSSDMDDISQYDLDLLDELRNKAHRPESPEELSLAAESDELIKAIFIETGCLDDDDAVGDEFICKKYKRIMLPITGLCPSPYSFSL